MDNIILIGFMGSGKTSVSIKLSYYMRCTMIDTDRLIEREEERSVSRIFEENGEAVFRDMETACLEKLLDSGEKGRIISVGGGLPVREENRLLLKRLGKVIYLRAKPETVYERLKGDDTRPLLKTENPLGKIRELMEKRSEAYENASDYIVDVDGKSLDEIIEELVHLV